MAIRIDAEDRGVAGRPLRATASASSPIATDWTCTGASVSRVAAASSDARRTRTALGPAPARAWSPSAAARIRWSRSRRCARPASSRPSTWIGGSQLIRACAERTGLPTLNIGRQLAPELFEYNRQGAYNGHIPVTAINSAILAFAAVLLGVDQVVFSNERSASYGSLIDPRHRRGEPPVVEGLGIRARFRRARAHARRRRSALLLAAAAAQRARGGAAVREDRSLRRAFLQLQPQLPPARRAPGQPLVRRVPEVPLRVPGAGAVHAQAAAGRRSSAATCSTTRRRRRLRCAARIPRPQAVRMRGRGPRVARGDGRAGGAPGVARGRAGGALPPRDPAAARRATNSTSRRCWRLDDEHRVPAALWDQLRAHFAA